MNSFLKRAKIIVLEGADMLGKTTQAKLLVFHLKKSNNVLYLKAPLKQCYLTYRLIYWMLSNNTALKYPNFFQFVQFVNRFIFQVLYLPLVSLFYDYIIIDRWKLSLLVYGIATKANTAFLTLLAALVIDPDFTIVLYGDSLKVDKKLDEYETDIELQNTVKRLYVNWALDNIDVDGTRCTLINANNRIDVVHNEIVRSCQKFCDSTS